MNIQMISASTTMRELQKKLDILSHNVANVNTSGYKRREATFQDVLTQNINNKTNDETGRITPEGIRVGHGAKLGLTNLRFEQGSAQATNRELDFMIEGDGVWFRTKDSDNNDVYTRDGNFQLLTEGNNLRLVTADGKSIVDTDGNPIQFESGFDRIEVSEQGTVNVIYPGNQPSSFQIGLVQIENAQELEAVGGNGFQVRDGQPVNGQNPNVQAIDLRSNNTVGVRIKQGMLEGSNVDLTKEMTELISTQRLLQFQGRSIKIADDMMGLANSIRG
ncbi:flagellar hook-basal body protein [Pseudalkalibacillus caeni]|uniref:Flagellar hook-basal body protein n=1 Tax=Exobacillus caeni TaxID=2574798 RepID=A0A5R9FAH3_9BACL|nr:flagellar hook-basal body protein [Pseudalkalibacillus caeni]TLS36625.1 flagellar hook-basal body protein [Pseudalkalibacillus caeni]